MTNLQLGIIGAGFVGGSVVNAFDTTTVDQWVVDPAKTDTSMEELLSVDPEIIFVCLPTPSSPDGSVDIGIVSEVLEQLSMSEYMGIVVLKSTITPDKLEAITDFYPLRIVYNPEFLRADHAIEDFINPSMQILGGAWDDCSTVERAYTQHSQVKNVPVFKTDVTTASLVKYTINSWLATKVTFMNEIQQLHGNSNANTSWEQFTQILSTDTRMGESHMQVPGPDGEYGFGGYCFPKDTQAFIKYGLTRGNFLAVLNKVIEQNNNHRIK